MNKRDGFETLVDYLAAFGIDIYTGVTGGGVVHYVKYLTPYEPNQIKPALFTISEYPAGFAPLGHYLATGKVGGAIATTGAATKLLACGLSDAKLHDIPSVYIFPISTRRHQEDSALQDTSIYGSNIIKQLEAEIEDVFLLDNPYTFAKYLEQAGKALLSRKPVVFLLDNEIMNLPMSEEPKIIKNKLHDSSIEIAIFVQLLKKKVKDRRVLLLVGEEGLHETDIRQLTTAVSIELAAATVWSMNGVNCVGSENPYGYGCISFGGNDKALNLWESMTEDDVVICVGVTPDEYTTNLQKFAAGDVFFITQTANAYGHIRGSFQHSALHEFHQINAPITKVLKTIITEGKREVYSTTASPLAPVELNTCVLEPPRAHYADMKIVYQHLHKWWQPGSLVISDVCLAYKDYQYVTQRPNDTITYFSFYRGSAMGGAYGVAVGAKLAQPDKRIYLFSGDGCFRLYGGSLNEAKNLGIVLFILDNHTYSIVAQGLPAILPSVPPEKYHDTLQQVDYGKIAEASGWLSYTVAPYLSNFEDILNELERYKKQSILVTIPVDPNQILGQNPRVRNL